MQHPPAGLDEIFLDQRETLVHLLFRMVGCRETAEDLAQESYIRVIGAAESQPITHARAFLFQTARNLALDHLRREKTRDRNDSRDADPEILAEVPATTPGPERNAAAHQSVDRLTRAMAGLSERRRQILILHKLELWPYERIARHLGISRSAVEKNLHAAMAQVMAAMGDDDF